MAENQKRGYCIDLMYEGQISVMSHRNYGADNHHDAAEMYEKELGFFIEHCSIYLAEFGVRLTAPGILKRKYYRKTENKI